MTKSSRLNFVCVDDSEFSDNGFNWYLENYHKKDDVVGVVHVSELGLIPNVGSMSTGFPSRIAIGNSIEESHKKAKAIKEKFEKICQKKELKCQYFVTDTHQRPGHVICELAAQKKADSITVGQRGLGALSRTLVGSTSDYILHHSNVPVMVVPPKRATN